MDDNLEPAVNAKLELSKPISKTQLSKPGDPGQPSVQEWHDEIARDLKVALGKLKMLDTKKLPPHLLRTMRQIEVTLASM
jgi:hypothetical protein